MIKTRPERPPHEISKNLSSTENESLIQLIDKEDGVTLATSIVQLWSSEKPTHVSWSKICSGVLCFVKDFTKKSYFFRLFSLNLIQLWETEMYTPFSYTKLTTNFHYFAADDCNVGFNFAFDDEADKFYSVVNEKLNFKREKTLRKSLKLNTTTTVTAPISTPAQALTFTPTPTPTPVNNSLSSQPVTLNALNSITSSAQSKISSLEKFSSLVTSSAHSTLSRAFGKVNKKKAPIDKIQISNPTDFQHLGHVGIGENDFKVNLPEDESSKVMRDLIASLNVPNVKANKKTEIFVSNFLKEKIGEDKYNEAISMTNTSIATSNTESGFMASTSTPLKIAPKPPMLPPPNYQPSPPPQSSIPAPPLHKPVTNTSTPAVPPIPPKITTSGPPPPPHSPPPPPHSPQPPPPLPSVPSSQSTSVPSPPPPLALPLLTIDTAPKTNTVTTASKPNTTKNMPAAPTSLLAAIQNFEGFKNKPVTQTSQSSDTTAPTQSESSILDQLKNELIKRAQFLNDSDDDENSSESDSEWN